MEDTFSVQSLSIVSAGRVLLNDLSFSIPRGTWLSVVGPNGAGKSTLLKGLAGIAGTLSGSWFLGKERLDTLSQRERACYLSYVPQQFVPLAPFTVDQFLSLALYAESSLHGESKVREAYELFRLDKFKRRSIQKLSVGEMQRVLLAAAFVQGSELLLLDEPSSALDPYEESEMLKVLWRLKREAKRTIVFVSHNLSSSLSLADTVLVLKEGVSTFLGSPRDIVSQRIFDATFGQEFSILEKGQVYSVIQQFPSDVAGSRA